ncbi:MAG: glycosyltransferase [Williamsia sp.]|nr:glycosyltransferase [Williamsia sp.]
MLAHHPIQNRDLVLFGFQPWEIQTGSNFVDMAYELSKYNRVLYVNRALDRITAWRQRKDPLVQARLQDIRKERNSIVKIQDQLWVLNPATVLESINWIPSAWLHDELNVINNERLAEEINKAIKALGFSHVILINDNDFLRGRYLKDLVKCDDYIFYLRDYLLGIDYFRRHGYRLEAETIHQATLVAANTAYLAAYASQWNPNSFDIGQGFRIPPEEIPPPSQETVPADIRIVPPPIIGYAGYISAKRIDTDIIATLAKELPHCSIVLMGSIDPVFPLKTLTRFSNIYFLGVKPFNQIKNYLRCFDVCINPQRVNETTRGNYPRKVDEYLIMGKPVVATRTEAMALFEGYTHLCTTATEWVSVIRKIISQPEVHGSMEEQKRRMLFALKHTWGSSMEKLGGAYYQVKETDQRKEEKHEKQLSSYLRVLTIYGLIAYLLFIYIKFIFF